MTICNGLFVVISGDGAAPFSTPTRRGTEWR